MYQSFFQAYRGAYLVGMFGYIIFVGLLVGGSLIVSVDAWSFLMQLSLMCLFYGLYFGVLLRDFAFYCSGILADRVARLASKGRTSSPFSCGLCTQDLPRATLGGRDLDAEEMGHATVDEEREGDRDRQAATATPEEPGLLEVIFPRLRVVQLGCGHRCVFLHFRPFVCVCAKDAFPGSMRHASAGGVSLGRRTCALSARKR